MELRWVLAALIARFPILAAAGEMRLHSTNAITEVTSLHATALGNRRARQWSSVRTGPAPGGHALGNTATAPGAGAASCRCRAAARHAAAQHFRSCSAWRNIITR
ncbi:hypothetical protein [Gemmobacter sp.]|uniref:hypothetical protein n=1 Tax=Gemmobacter sp. TaxID=1898957 RepID=UPI00391D7CC7